MAGSAAEVRLHAEETAPCIGIVSVEVVDIDDFRLQQEVLDQVVVEANDGREVLEIVIANFEVERGLLVERPGAANPQGPLAAPRSVVVRAVAEAADVDVLALEPGSPDPPLGQTWVAPR